NLKRVESSNEVEGCDYGRNGTLRSPHVGGGGSVERRSTGFSCNSFIATATASSSCGSWPAITSLGLFYTSISGGMPSFSTAHLPSRVKNPPRGAIIVPPS